MALIVLFVWTARMFEMRFGASIWENYEAKDQCDPKRNEDDPSWAAQRAECAFGHDDAKQSIRASTANQTGLVAQGRQQDKTRNQRTNRCSSGIKQRRKPGTVHPVTHTRLDLSCNNREQDAGKHRDGEHQRNTQNRNLPPTKVEHTGRRLNQFTRKKQI